jgi:NAD(P)-dependent dehydrogenase (short-subunit alcohol dehydrogenase family)
MMDVNVNALFHVTRAVLPGLVSRGRGHVVIIGSIAGRSAFVGGAGYATTKHAVMGFAENLMLEVRDDGVKVSVVSPGSVATTFGGRSEPKGGAQLLADDVAVEFRDDFPGREIDRRQGAGGDEAADALVGHAQPLRDFTRPQHGLASSMSMGNTRIGKACSRSARMKSDPCVQTRPSESTVSSRRAGTPHVLYHDCALFTQLM